jgi:hypothetical protein
MDRDLLRSLTAGETGVCPARHDEGARRPSDREKHSCAQQTNHEIDNASVSHGYRHRAGASPTGCDVATSPPSPDGISGRLPIPCGAGPSRWANGIAAFPVLIANSGHRIALDYTVSIILLEPDRGTGPHLVDALTESLEFNLDVSDPSTLRRDELRNRLSAEAISDDYSYMPEEGGSIDGIYLSGSIFEAGAYGLVHVEAQLGRSGKEFFVLYTVSCSDGWMRDVTHVQRCIASPVSTSSLAERAPGAAARAPTGVEPPAGRPRQTPVQPLSPIGPRPRKMLPPHESGALRAVARRAGVAVGRESDSEEAWGSGLLGVSARVPQTPPRRRASGSRRPLTPRAMDGKERTPLTANAIDHECVEHSNSRGSQVGARKGKANPRAPGYINSLSAGLKRDPLLGDHAVLLELMHWPVQTTRVDPELLGDLADGDTRALTDQAQDILLTARSAVRVEPTAPARAP